MSQSSLSVGGEAYGSAVARSLSLLSRRRQAVSWRAAALRLGWLGVAGLLAALLVDAGAGLPGIVRLAVLGGVLGGTAAVVVTWWRRPSEPDATAQRRLARALERQQGVPHDRLVNALLLRAGAVSRWDDPLTRALAERGVAGGERAMAGVDVAAAVDREAVRREAARLWAVAVAWGVVLLIQPGVVGHGLARVALPWADVPAFSLTRLAVMVEPTSPTVGDDVAVTVVVSGVKPSGPATVVLAGEGGEVRRWPMRAGGDATGATWRHTFHALREPVRFRVEAGSARTRWQVVEPTPEPAEAMAGESAGPGGPEAGEVDEPVSVNGGRTREGTADTAGATLTEHLATLHALMQEAAALRDLAEALMTAEGLDAATLEAMLSALHAQVSAFVDDAAALAAAVEAMAAGMDEPVRGQLIALAEQLRASALADVEMGDAAAALPGVREAAEADREALAGHGEGLAEAAAGVLSDAGEPALPTRWADPAAQGTYDVTVDSADEIRAQLRAMSEQAPRAYRALVERYFQTLSEEAVSR